MTNPQEMSRNECPICNKVDPDGMEACAECYNGVWARAAQWEQRAKAAEARLAAALDGVVVGEHPTLMEPALIEYYDRALGRAKEE